IAGIGGIAAFKERNIAVEDASLDHRIAAHFEREMFARAEKIGWHVDRVAASLDRLDWRPGGDAAHHWHGDRPAAFVLGQRTYAAEIAFDHAWGEAARARRRHAVRNRFGKLDHLDGARAIRQAADEAALLECRDQTMNAGFGAQVERILHLVERGRNACFFQALMDKTKEFCLLARQHRRFPLWPPGSRNKS